MIYSELVKLSELNKKLEEKYGKFVLNNLNNSEIGWHEVVTIIRFGHDYKQNPEFIKENSQINFGHLPKEVFSVREELIKKLPNWVEVITVKNKPLKIFTCEQELEMMRRKKDVLIPKIGEAKYNELVKKLEDYIKNKK